MTASGQLSDYLGRLAALGGVVSAGEAIVATPDNILFRHAVGYRVGGERLTAGSGARFDAASLTKLWVATLGLALDPESRGDGSDRDASQGRDDKPRLSLRERLTGSGATLEALLRHRSGMPAWTPLGVRLGKRLGLRDALVRFLLEQLDSLSTRDDSGLRFVEGEERSEVVPFNGSLSSAAVPFNEGLSPFALHPTLYSDLDYLLWGLVVEERLGRPWTELLDEHVCSPLEIANVGAASSSPAVAVECRLDNGTEVELAAARGIALTRARSYLNGVVQDGNARALRSVGIPAAHAGLFVTADEMLALGREWLRPGRLLSRDQVDFALSGDGEYALGWARWSEDGSSGPALSRSSFGHTGFTGGSLWIDPDRRRLYVLLAHRLSSAIDFNPFRREFHRLAAEF